MLRVTIIAAVVPFAKLANTRSVNHLEGKFLIILRGERVFITNVKGTFLGMSESEEASKRR